MLPVPSLRALLAATVHEKFQQVPLGNSIRPHVPTEVHREYINHYSQASRAARQAAKRSSRAQACSFLHLSNQRVHLPCHGSQRGTSTCPPLRSTRPLYGIHQHCTLTKLPVGLSGAMRLEGPGSLLTRCKTAAAVDQPSNTTYTLKPPNTSLIASQATPRQRAAQLTYTQRSTQNN